MVGIKGNARAAKRPFCKNDDGGPVKKSMVSKPVCGGSDVSSSCVKLETCDANCDIRVRDFPKLYQCHACGARGSFCGNNKLRPLKSRWRVVLLCKLCFVDIDSKKVCSYCFMKIPDPFLGFSCVVCSRYFHENCVPKQQSSCNDRNADPFLCVDCWVPRSRVKFSNGSVGLENEGNRGTLGNHGLLKVAPKEFDNRKNSSNGSMGSLLSDGSQPVEELVREAKYAAAKAATAAIMANVNAVRKMIAAKKALTLAKGALYLASVKKNPLKNSYKRLKVEDGKNGSTEPSSIVGDEELARRLHCAMNSSPRIWKKTYVRRVHQSSTVADNICANNPTSLLSRIGSEHLGGCYNELDDTSKSDSASLSVCGSFNACDAEKSQRTIPNVHGYDMELVDLALQKKSCANADLLKEDTAFDSSHQCVVPILDGVGESSFGCLEGERLGLEDIKHGIMVEDDHSSCSSRPENFNGAENSLDTQSISCQQKFYALSSTNMESAQSQNKPNLESKPEYECLDGKEPCRILASEGCLTSDLEFRKYGKKYMCKKGISRRKNMPNYEDLSDRNQQSYATLSHWNQSSFRNAAPVQ